MSSASVPNPLGGALPERAPSRPEIVKPVPPKPRPRGLWWGAAALAIAAGVGVYLNYGRVPPKEGGGGPGAAAFRTAVVSVGEVHRTLRLTGSVTAERFAALMAPQLRGSRNSMSGNRMGTRGGGGGSASSTVSATSTSSSGSSSSASSSSSTSASTMTINSSNSSNSTSASDPSASGSAGGAAASSLGATRGSGNRFGDRLSSASSSSKGSSGSSPKSSSSSLGSSGLGSTAGSLPPTSGGGGGGGGGGGMSDFMLVLLDLPVPGGRVKKGDVVAEFDRQNMLNRIDDYKDSVVQAEANIKNKKANLAVAQEAHDQQVRVAKADMDKAKLDLQTVQVVSDIDAEKLKLAAEETEARYKQLLKDNPLLAKSQKADLRGVELSRDVSKIELQKAVSNADHMILKAPMDGIVVMQSIRRGMEFAQVQKGDQIYAGQMFMQVVDPGSMVVNASANQVDAEQLRIGQKATVHLDAYPGLELPAHVFSIGAVPVAGRRPNFMRQIPIRLKLDKVDPRVLPDLSASADVILDSEQQATLAPLAAIFQDGPATKPFVFLRSPAGWDKREVQLGLRSNTHVAVRAGLGKGDVVALDPPTESAAGKPPS